MYVIVYGSVFIGFFNMKWENMNTYKILASIIAFLGFVWYAACAGATVAAGQPLAGPHPCRCASLCRRGILGTLLHGSAGACVSAVRVTGIASVLRRRD